MITQPGRFALGLRRGESRCEGITVTPRADVVQAKFVQRDLDGLGGGREPAAALSAGKLGELVTITLAQGRHLRWAGWGAALV